jgi:hypothetical protein
MPRLDLRKAFRPVAEEEEPLAYERTEGPYGKLDMPAGIHWDKDGMLPLSDNLGEIAPVCPDMSPKWAVNAAHATHFITLEDLQHYYNPRTTWENSIMTLAHDKLEVVDHALEHRYPRGAPFRSPLLNKLAYHMEQKHRDRGVHGEWNAFFVMTHVLHMHEISLMIKERYHQVSPTEMTCSCIAKNEHSIRHELIEIAKFFSDKENQKLTEKFEMKDEWHIAQNTLEQVRRDSVFMSKTHGFANDAAMYLKCKLRRF